MVGEKLGADLLEIHIFKGRRINHVLRVTRAMAAVETVVVAEEAAA